MDGLAGMLGMGHSDESSQEEALEAAKEVAVEHMDYDYVNKCEDVKYLVQILLALRSGKEGRYPHLEQHTEARIRSLDPQNKILHPAKVASSTRRELSGTEVERMERELAALEESYQTRKGRGQSEGSLPPIRAAAKTISIASTSEAAKPKASQANSGDARKQQLKQASKGERIAGSDFRAWDKYDVEKALKDVDDDSEDEGQDDSAKSNKSQKSGTTAQKPAGQSGVRLPPTEVSSVPTSAAARVKMAEDEKRKGNEAFRAHDYEEAVVYYTRSLHVFDSSVCRCNRAQAYLKMEKYAEAEMDAEVVLLEDATNSKAMFRRGVARMHLGKLAEAKADFAALAAKEPNNKMVKKVLGEVNEEMAKQAARKSQPTNDDKQGEELIIREASRTADGTSGSMGQDRVQGQPNDANKQKKKKKKKKLVIEEVDEDEKPPQADRATSGLHQDAASADKVVPEKKRKKKKMIIEEVGDIADLAPSSQQKRTASTTAAVSKQTPLPADDAWKKGPKIVDVTEEELQKEQAGEDDAELEEIATAGAKQQQQQQQQQEARPSGAVSTIAEFRALLQSVLKRDDVAMLAGTLDATPLKVVRGFFERDLDLLSEDVLVVLARASVLASKKKRAALLLANIAQQPRFKITLDFLDTPEQEAVRACVRSLVKTCRAENLCAKEATDFLSDAFSLA